jgi:hypothetical protein
MEDGVTYANALYLIPDSNPGGFIHSGLNFDLLGVPKRVLLSGKFGFADGASGTNGVAFSVFYLEDDRSYQSPSYLPATHWQNHAFLEKRYDGTLKQFTFDITPLLDKPAVGFGIENLGDSTKDWAYLTEFKLNWYGQEINLLNSSLLSQFNWHSSQGAVPWGSSGPQGTAQLATVTMEDRITYVNALFLQPDSSPGGFMHSGMDFGKVSPYINPCQ